MAKYEAIEKFRDIEDNHIYEANDPYPYKGRAKKARIEALTTADNQSGRPLIREVDDEA